MAPVGCLIELMTEWMISNASSSPSRPARPQALPDRQEQLMRRSTPNRTVPLLALLAAPALLAGGCAAIQRYEERDTERMLAAAGFHTRPADTPERQEDLRSIPPHRIVSRTKDGSVVYIYADPDNCHCLYVGGNKEYSEYERLRVQREITQRRAGSAGGAP
jgi:hypothetical protein